MKHYLRFEREGKDWSVFSVQTKRRLGTIHWHRPIRSFVFIALAPPATTVFKSNYLLECARFIDMVTAEYWADKVTVAITEATCTDAGPL
jgi:hypothetical protein